MGDISFSEIPAIVVSNGGTSIEDNPNFCLLPGSRPSSSTENNEGVFSDWSSDFSAEESNESLVKSKSKEDKAVEIFQTDKNKESCLPEEVRNTPQNYKEYSERIMLGDLSNVSFNVKRKVKIYVSSAGQDTGAERHRVMISVVPKLVSFCRSNKLSFEIVDLKPFNGTSKNNMYLHDQEVDELRIKQVVRSRENSLGPSFLPLSPTNAYYYFMSGLVPYSVSLVPYSLTYYKGYKTLARKRGQDLYLKTGRSFISHTCGTGTTPQSRLSFEFFTKIIQGIENSMLKAEEKMNLIKQENENDPKIDKQIRVLADELRNCREAIKLLNSWYQLNKNTVPPTYKLKKITKNGHDNFKTDAKYKKELRRNMTTMSKVNSILKKYSTTNNNDKTMQHSLNDVWNEVQEGIISSKDPHVSCFWVKRVVSDIKENLDDENIGSFLHAYPGLLRLKEDNELLHNHIVGVLDEKLGIANTREYNITWKTLMDFYKGNKAFITGTKTLYIEKISFDLYYALTQMIERDINQDIIHHLAQNSYETDIMESQKFARCMAKNYIPNNFLVNEIRHYVCLNESCILFVCGKSGCGKSSLLSYTALNVHNWINLESILSLKRRKPIVLFRAMDTSGKLDSKEYLIKSLCYQMKKLLLHENEKKKSEIELPDDIEIFPYEDLILQSLETSDLILHNTFKSYLNACQDYINSTIVFIIDNIDITSLNSNWLPKVLPSNIRFIISVSSSKLNGKLPATLKQSVKNYDVKILEIPMLEKEVDYTNVSERRLSRKSLTMSISIKNLLKIYLKKHKVKLSAEETDVIFHTINHCPLPLVVEICAEIAKYWTSYTSSSDILKIMPTTGYLLSDFVLNYFKIIEEEFGFNLVSSCLSFITISKHGIAHFEMVELLSRDKKTVIQTCHLYSTMEKQKSFFMDNDLEPQCKNYAKRCDTVGELTVLWYKLFEKIKFLFIETVSDEILTLKFKHNIYKNVSEKRYLSSKETHQRYAQIMQLYFSNIASPCQCGRSHDCVQPVMWKSGQACVSGTVFNIRRLSESLPLALICGNMDRIKKDMLFSYQWLYAKINGCSLQELNEEIKKVLKVCPQDKDLQLFSSTLFLSQKVIEEDAAQLSSQLVGRLCNIVKSDKPSTRYDPRMFPLIRKLYKEAKQCHHKSLMPSTGCLQTSRSILFDPLCGHEDVISAISSFTDGRKIITSSKDASLKVWDVLTRRVTCTIDNVGNDIIKMSSCMGNFYIATMNAEYKICIWNIRQGSCELTISPSSSSDTVTFTTTREGQLLVVFSRLKGIMSVWNLENLKKVRDVELMKYNYDSNWKITVADRGRANNVFYGFCGRKDSMVVNAKRGKYLQKIECKSGSVTKVAASREYYVIACHLRHMHVHEIQCFHLHDVINYGYLRTIKACPDDIVQEIFINMLGSHMIGICKGKDEEEGRETELVVWSMDQDDHQHIAHVNADCTLGTCIDLQYCIIASKFESSPRIFNLAAKIDDTTHSRTHIKSKTDGVRELFPITTNDKYVVARGFDNGPISIWNVAKGKRKGESVIIERGLLEKTDIVVVKNDVMVVLSDRGLSSGNDALQVFETLYVYNLMLRKYERKIHPVSIHPCPVEEYLILGGEKLMAPSPNRTCFIVWSLENGQVLFKLSTDFSIYENFEKQQEKLSLPSRRIRKKKPRVLSEAMVVNSKWKTSWKPCHITCDERSKLIHDVIISADESTLICSYFTRHLTVFNLQNQKHVHTLTDANSILQLNNCSKISTSGKHFVITNHNSENQSAYVTLWCLQNGCVLRRLSNVPNATTTDMTDDADRIVYVTDQNLIKVWDPFKNKATYQKPVAKETMIESDNERICYYSNNAFLDLKSSSEPGYCESLKQKRHSLKSTSIPSNQQKTKGKTNKEPMNIIKIINKGSRAVLVNKSISLWDLNEMKLIARFTPDDKIHCFTMAMDDHFMVFGMKGYSDIITLWLQPFCRDDKLRKKFMNEIETSSSDEFD